MKEENESQTKTTKKQQLKQAITARDDSEDKIKTRTRTTGAQQQLRSQGRQRKKEEVRTRKKEGRRKQKKKAGKRNS